MLFFAPRLTHIYCIVCGLSKTKDPSISLHRIPKLPEIRKKWTEGLGLTQEDITVEFRGCSKHFCDGNSRTIPSIHLGPNFADHPSSETPREKHQTTHESHRQQQWFKRHCVRTSSPVLNLTPPFIPEPL